MAISCSECEGHQDIACPDCGKDYYLRDTEAQAEIARLQAEVERLRGVLRKRTQEAEDSDYRAYTAWNDAIEAASDPDLILDAIDSVHDMDVTHADYARAVSAAIRALKRPAGEVSNG